YLSISYSLFLSIFFFITSLLPIFPLFPYTTLFRSICTFPVQAKSVHGLCLTKNLYRTGGPDGNVWDDGVCAGPSLQSGGCARERSEEHTSELQSLRHLVCRLLLEKKKEKVMKIYSL